MTILRVVRHTYTRTSFWHCVCAGFTFGPGVHFRTYQSYPGEDEIHTNLTMCTHFPANTPLGHSFSYARTCLKRVNQYYVHVRHNCLEPNKSQPKHCGRTRYFSFAVACLSLYTPLWSTLNFSVFFSGGGAGGRRRPQPQPGPETAASALWQVGGFLNCLFMHVFLHVCARVSGQNHSRYSYPSKCGCPRSTSVLVCHLMQQAQW